MRERQKIRPVDIGIDCSRCVGRPPCVKNAVVGRHQKGRERRIREIGKKEAMGRTVLGQQ